MTFLDTSVLVALSREATAAAALDALREVILPDTPVRVSGAAAAEMLNGTLRSKDPAAAYRRVEEFLGAFLRAPLTDEHLLFAKQLIAVMANRPIGCFDTLIAAAAVSDEEALVTSDVEDFRRVPRLAVIPFPSSHELLRRASRRTGRRRHGPSAGIRGEPAHPV